MNILYVQLLNSAVKQTYKLRFHKESLFFALAAWPHIENEKKLTFWSYSDVQHM